MTFFMKLYQDIILKDFIVIINLIDSFLAKCNGNEGEIRKISDDVVSNLARGPSCGYCHVVIYFLIITYIS